MGQTTPLYPLNPWWVAARPEALSSKAFERRIFDERVVIYRAKGQVTGDEIQTGGQRQPAVVIRSNAGGILVRRALKIQIAAEPKSNEASPA